MYSTLLSIAALAIGALAAPGSSHLEARAAPDNTVYVTDQNKYCMIMPRDAHTNIGDSEHPGGMKAYCSSSGRYDNSQGKLPDNFWSNIAFASGTSSRGARYAQLTGCIRPETLSRLNPDDGGGQYDSSGGDGGQGNPQGSVCLGYVLIFGACYFGSWNLTVRYGGEYLDTITTSNSLNPRKNVPASSAAIIMMTALLIKILPAAPLSSQAITSTAVKLYQLLSWEVK
ncbi:unnamed protein product [Rhizoctonia solani]|uniref:Uncharacterized protein n=1 Tax=Rhizoctonia solani TaxID=456999 RepID=A0A8H2W688_9AGAM|nr:unnamed protein product [Rhizoctonia solani]